MCLAENVKVNFNRNNALETVCFISKYISDYETCREIFGHSTFFGFDF
jgi:hypothetical protein